MDKHIDKKKWIYIVIATASIVISLIGIFSFNGNAEHITFIVFGSVVLVSLMWYLKFEQKNTLATLCWSCALIVGSFLKIAIPINSSIINIIYYFSIAIIYLFAMIKNSDESWTPSTKRK